MNNIIKDNDKDQFANGQISRDLRANWGGTEPQTRLDAVNVIEQCPDVAREEFSASENWERVRQWRVSRFLPEQIDADERLPGYLREPHLPRFESRNRVMPIHSRESLKVTRQTRTHFYRARMQFVENRL